MRDDAEVMYLCAKGKSDKDWTTFLVLQDKTRALEVAKNTAAETGKETMVVEVSIQPDLHEELLRRGDIRLEDGVWELNSAAWMHIVRRAKRTHIQSYTGASS